MDTGEIKDRQRRIWGLGDYSRLSRTLEPAATALCEACGVGPGQEVLDVAAGDGNFALAAARAGARVVASDISPGMVERGRARTEAEGQDIEWLEADAEELPFEGERFDCVGSVFGAMIAPRPEVAARELFRVARPGGTVGMTAWTPDSFLVELFSITRKYQPLPPDLPRAEEWAEEETLRRRFGDLPETVRTERKSLALEFQSIEEFDELQQSAPPAVALRQALPDDQWAAMHAEQLELLRARSGDDGRVSVEADYVLIVARKRESS